MDRGQLGSGGSDAVEEGVESLNSVDVVGFFYQHDGIEEGVADSLDGGRMPGQQVVIGLDQPVVLLFEFTLGMRVGLSMQERGGLDCYGKGVFDCHDAVIMFLDNGVFYL